MVFSYNESLSSVVCLVSTPCQTEVDQVATTASCEHVRFLEHYVPTFNIDGAAAATRNTPNKKKHAVTKLNQ